ncbi:MAG: TspO/MBR family protein [Bifidobacterium sp.]|uniref:TspO/MBR family protein n=1 Tax=Bifidobacterium sp. TaxID=41200 RepID=UPI0039E7832F
MAERQTGSDQARESAKSLNPLDPPSFPDDGNSDDSVSYGNVSDDNVSYDNIEGRTVGTRTADDSTVSEPSQDLTADANEKIPVESTGNPSSEPTSEPKTKRVSQTSVLWICWAIMVAFNAYSELGRLGGTTTGEISNREFAWFTPAGYVFAIWGVIYIALAVFLAVLPREHLPLLWSTGFNAVGILFVISCILNVSWLIAWHYEQFTASMIIIVAVAISVWLMYALLRRAGAGILAWAPISIYASWLAVATCANASYLAVHQYPNVDTTVQATTTFFLLILLLGGAFAIRTRLQDWVSPLVVIWAAIGIGVRLFDSSAPIGVIIIAMTAIGALLIYFPWGHYSIVPNAQADAQTKD